MTPIEKLEKVYHKEFLTMPDTNKSKKLFKEAFNEVYEIIKKYEKIVKITKH